MRVDTRYRNSTRNTLILKIYIYIYCTWCLTSTETIKLIRDGEKVGGRGCGGGGEREIIYLSLHCHHQYDSCIKMDSDESHFNVSLTVGDKVTRLVPTNHNF